MPLDVMLSVMHEGIRPEPMEAPWRDLGRKLIREGRFTIVQYNAAVAAAAFCHPKLQAVQVQQTPDAGTERRRSLLAALPYHVRREITAILETAELADADGTLGRVVEAVAEQPEPEPEPEWTEDGRLTAFKSRDE